jgi:hypothetical protein
MQTLFHTNCFIVTTNGVLLLKVALEKLGASCMVQRNVETQEVNK